MLSAHRYRCPPYRMPSTNFTNLATSTQELKRIYLDAGLSTQNPSPEHQELARAFVALVHAEFEYFLEEALRELATAVLEGAKFGRFSRASLALLSFSGLQPLNGGAVLSAGSTKAPRRLATRIGEAHGALMKIVDGNNGAREKHLAAMAIPLGLDHAAIDPTWLSDLDAFCSMRGAFVHMSRTSRRGSHLAVNPHDVWDKCKRLIWTNFTLATPGAISSFESLDLWVETEKQCFGPIVVEPRLRFNIRQFLSDAFRRFRKKDQAFDEDD